MYHHNHIRKIAYISLMTALLETVKWALNSFANIELISLLTILFTILFGWQISLPVILLFCTVECLWWGFSIWTITYYYVWPLLIICTWVSKKYINRNTSCIISGVFGLCFGFLCSLTTLIAHGPAAALSWWIAGIPYDVIHGVSNFILAYFLFNPLKKALVSLRIKL